MKKWITLITCAIMCIAMSLFVVGCEDNTPKVTLVDFSETATAEVDWGEEYSLRRIVEDDANKSYSLTAVVKTKKSNTEVAVISGKFVASDPNGYVITYSAKISEKDTRTSIVTLNVKIDEPISIILPEVTTVYTAGAEITIPEASVKDVREDDASGKATVKSMKYVDSADKKEYNNIIVGAKYTPEFAGKLSVVYTYTAQEGVKDKTLVIEVGVKREADKAIASGKDAVLDLVQTSDKTKLEWNVEKNCLLYSAKTVGLDTGYTKMDFSSVAKQHFDEISNNFDYFHIKVKPIRTKEHNDRAKVVLFESNATNWYLYDESSPNGANLRRMPFNEWSDIYLPLEIIDMKMPLLMAEFNKASNNYAWLDEIYLDGFDLVKKANLTVTQNIGETANNKATVTFTVGTDREDAIVANHTLIVKDAVGTVINPTKNGNVWTAEGLVPSEYTYEVEVDDKKYVLDEHRGAEYNPNKNVEGDYVIDCIDGSFIVNKGIVINKPRVSETYVTGNEIIIPTATATRVSDDSTVTGVTVKSMKYVDFDGFERTVTATFAKYTPVASGTLYITYTHAEAVDITLEIPVGKNVASNTGRAIMSGKDGLFDIVINREANQTKLEWNEEQHCIVFAPKTAATVTGYPKVDFNSTVKTRFQQIKGDYDFFHIRVNPRRIKENSNRAKVILFESDAINHYLYDSKTKNYQNPRRMDWNEWSDIYLPVERIGNQVLLFAELNKAGNNYDGMTEIWLNGFDFVKKAELSATFSQDVAKDGTANVTVTVTAGADKDYTLTVKDAQGATVDGVREGNVWSSNTKLPVNQTYTYELALANTPGVVLYEHRGAEYNPNTKVEADYVILCIIGTYVVKDSTMVKLPSIEGQTFVAGTAITIPSAIVIDIDGSKKADAVVKSIVYTDKADGKVYNDIEATAKNYTPEFAGTLSITYGYQNLQEQTLDISVGVNTAKRDGKLLATGKDGLLDVTYSNTTAKLTWDNTNNYYVFKPNEGQTKTFWTDIIVKQDVIDHVNAIKNDYDYLHFRINCRQLDNKNHPEWLARVRLFQGTTNNYLYGTDNGSYEDLDRFAFNEWCDIYVPVSFVDFSKTTNQLLSGQFFRDNSGADYCNMTEMWIDGLEFVKTASLKETKLTVTAVTTETSATITVANGMTGHQMVGYTLNVFKGTNAKVEVTGVIENNVWTATNLEPGTYTYKIKVTNSEAVFINDNKVTEYITGTFMITETPIA